MEKRVRGLLAGITVICSILVLLHPLPREALASAPQKRLLVLYSQDHGLPAHELTDKAIRATVKANPTFAIQIFSEFLDLSRFGGPPRRQNKLVNILGCPCSCC